MPNKDFLKFKVAPHIVQDLGLNLYTTLPRVLVELVANAYDADSPDSVITLNADAIKAARELLRANWKAEIAAKDPKTVKPLELRTLPDGLQIVVEDHGHGMTRQELQDKYLLIGRRKRDDDKTDRSPGNRVLMGRKGIGKLAGFGVAHCVTVISRAKGETHATKITLHYGKLVENRHTDEVQVPTEKLADGGGITPHGTRVVLSELMYDSAKSREDSVVTAVADYFTMAGTEFSIVLNGKPLGPSKRTYAFAYPKNGEEPADKLILAVLPTETGPQTFSYRIRFTGPGGQLDARERGIRVYAHGRLAAAPDLLDIKTSIHGVNNTHYLDGIVHADFIDEQPIDYVSSNRQTLRWDTPLLVPFREFLTKELHEAIVAYQKLKDQEIGKKVRADQFTKDLIEKSGLPKHRKAMAYKIAADLAGGKGEEVQDPFYKRALPVVIKGLHHGDLIGAIAEIAEAQNPDFQKLVTTISQLTHQEFDDFMEVVRARLDGIAALQKLYKTADFGLPDNEDELHRLFDRCPWLIDPTFTQFLVSNKGMLTVQERLAKELKVGKHIPADYKKDAPEEVAKEEGVNLRPDLVSLLTNVGLKRVVIIELKSPNTPLNGNHLRQLQDYMQLTKEFLETQGEATKGFKVEGYLIGTMPNPKSKAKEARWLLGQIQETDNKADWKVFDIGEVLLRTEAAHHELLEVHAAQEKSADEEETATASA